MKCLPKTAVIMAAAVLAMCTLLACSRDSQEAVPNAVEAKKLTDLHRRQREAQATEGGLRPIILIVNSNACKCVRDRCHDAQEHVTKAVHDHGLASKLSIIDYGTQRGKAIELFKKHRVHIIPVVLVFDENGNLLYQNEFDIDYGDLDKALKSLGGRK